MRTIEKDVHSWRQRSLAKGEKNLSALKAAHANPKTSPAGKVTLAEAIVKQGQINAKLEKMLGMPSTTPSQGRPPGLPRPPPPLGG